MHSPPTSHEITHLFQTSLQTLAFPHHRSPFLLSVQPQSESSHRPLPALQLLHQSHVSVLSLFAQPINQPAIPNTQLHQRKLPGRDSAVLQRPPSTPSQPTTGSTNIYNPTTTIFSTLPKLDCVSRHISGMNLGFDPAKSPHYKVVCVTKLGKDRYQIELYSSERGRWRKCGQPFALATETGAHINFTKGVYWNGAIHWLSYGEGDSLYFNLENETSCSFSTPPHQQGDGRRSVYFGESCDHLHYIEMPSRQVEFDVYEMKRDYSEWFVKYKVDLRGVVASYPEMILKKHDACVISFFSVIRGEKEEDSFLVFHIPGRVVRYDLASGTYRTIHIFTDAEDEVRDKCLRYWETNGLQHIESLSCV